MIATFFSAFLQPNLTQEPGFDWLKLVAVLIALISTAFAIYQYAKRRSDAGELEAEKKIAHKKVEDEIKRAEAKTAEQRLRDTLEEELGHIRILGSPHIENLPVKLLDSFVRVNISQDWRSDFRFGDGEKGELDFGEEMHLAPHDLNPDEAVKRAFNKRRLLVLIGDPGSGKTTLMKYFAVCCLHGDQRKLGFKNAVLPLYFPLREAKFDENDQPISLPENLAEWAGQRTLDLTPDDFKNWLRSKETLVLLDGLDEIGDVEQRIRVCDWIDKTCFGFKRARFVVTSRWTGYRKGDGVEIAFDHMRADVKDFSPEQQDEFLKKWFRAAFLREDAPPGKPSRAWEEAQRQKADQKSTTIIKFLRAENERRDLDWRGGLRELAAVPMLLQIMAIIWKEREHLPEGRRDLYNAALDYLLALRDKRRKLEPLLPAEKARRVLAPVSWNMQNAAKKQRRDEVSREKMHDQMQPILDSMNRGLGAEAFCRNLIDRAGVLAEYGRDDYIFRHKSLREFLAAEQMAKAALKDDAVLKILCDNFGDDWWEEPTRFFMLLADDEMFDRFMAAFFANEKSGSLEVKALDLLQTLVREAPQKKIDALEAALNDKKLDETRRRTVLECLKTIGAPLATEPLKKFLDSQKAQWLSAELRMETSTSSSKQTFRGAPKPAPPPKTEVEATITYAREVLAQTSPDFVTKRPTPQKPELAKDRPKSFLNPFENNAEYILIPGGEYQFSVTKKFEKVPDMYFAKYPVTNRLYRRFIDYLGNEKNELRQTLPLPLFTEKMLTFAESIPKYRDYLGTDAAAWAEKLTSGYEKDRRFNDPEQPVAGVSWYAARAYCFWLSMLETTKSEHSTPSFPRRRESNDRSAPRDSRLRGNDEMGEFSVEELANIYRLPKEVEWEWAAYGRDPAAKGAVREYPWPKAKGKPTPTLANFGKNIGKTTPVGRYPEGGTPEGLLDIAGNVWEWQENFYDQAQFETARARRGGSWFSGSDSFVRSARSLLNPGLRINSVGFRVCAPSLFN